MVTRLAQLKEKVESLFYAYGLFCSTHQTSTMLFAILSVLFVCYPLRNIPFLGNAPSAFETLVSDYRVPDKFYRPPSAPRWYDGVPIGYVQQILVKSTVAPWDRRRLRPTDAFRGPLHKVFSLLQAINHFQYHVNSSSVSLDHVCLHVAEPSVKERLLLPQYGCLVLSPANLWQNQVELFSADGEIIKTIYDSARSSYAAAPRLREILFGVPWLETGLMKYFIRHQQRTLQYSITIVYKKFDPPFIEALTERLVQLFPLSVVNRHDTPSKVSHISYRESSTSYLVDYTPLIAAYLILFLYIYFSVQKIEMVKSKWGLAVSAVMTVIMSLLMSISICAVFGVTPSVNSGEIFPYLVVIIGLENVLVLTRSVVSTPLNLEVKVRVAEGLKKEGWNITKHLITELLILVCGFFTFAPAIQEFCLFASIGLLVDFYLQMVFFATVLSIDIRRLELSDLDNAAYLHIQGQDEKLSMPKESLHPKSSFSHDIFFVASFFHIPKRIKVMNFIAQFRVVQRLIMFCTVTWISVVLYKTGILSSIVSKFTLYKEPATSTYFHFDINDTKLPVTVRDTLNTESLQPSLADILYQEPLEENWKRLSFMHWPGLFSLYNKSIVGTYISFLPSIKLSILITPEEAIGLHSDKLTAEDSFLSPDAEELDDNDPVIDAAPFDIFNGTHIYSLNYTERFVLGLTVTSGLVIFAWLLTCLYGIMCGRNYHNWRTRRRKRLRESKYGEYLKEVSMFYMEEHKQPIECMSVDGALVVTSCLIGDICIWDALTGEVGATIRRRQISERANVDDDFKMRQQSDSTLMSGRASGDSASTTLSRGLGMFDLSPFVNTHFNKMEKRSFAQCLQDIEDERILLQASHSPTSFEDSGLQFGYRGHSRSSGSVTSDSAFYSESLSAPSIWSLDARDGLIVAGCSDGSLEFWESLKGSLKYVYRSHRTSGICSVRLAGSRLVMGRSDGYVDFVEVNCLPLPQTGQSSDSGLTPVRFHRRVPSRQEKPVWVDLALQCSLLQCVKAHQSTVHLLDVAGGRCLTASADKFVKVFRLDDAACLFTLHGHSSAISAICVDKATPHIALSASEDGCIHLWDLITGACIHKLNGMLTAVLCVASSGHYIAASSIDSVICIWDKGSGRLLHSIQRVTPVYSGALSILWGCLLVVGGKDTLQFWDLSSGDLAHCENLPVGRTFDGVCKLVSVKNTAVVAVQGSKLHSVVFQRKANQKHD